MIGWRIKVNIIAFVVIAIGLCYLMATQVLSILEDRYSVYAIFPDAGGVFTNQEVTYRGITVGQVGEMEVVDKGVRIELLIREETKVPKEDTEARVMFKSAVGEQFVDLLPGNSGAPFFEDGDEIPLEQTSIPVSTQELLSTLEAVLRGVPPEDLEGAVDALGIGLTGRGPDIATILESTADLATLFAERGPEVEGILRNGTTVGGAFLESREDFETAIRELVTVAATLDENTGNLQRLMQGGNRLSDALVRLIRENRPQLNEFLREFGKVNQFQARHARDISELLKHLPDGLARILTSFEPSTGLIRFGLVNDDENHACSYGTNRRPPSDRRNKFPPLNAHCSKRAERSSSPTSSQPATEAEAGGSPIDVGAGPQLPARMSEWSWTLMYLQSV
jgi:phospholipid/cholesterol/gamma-HCH transport system substrate-binding protein